MDLGASAATNNNNNAGVLAVIPSPLTTLSDDLKAERLLIGSEVEALRQLHSNITDDFDNLARITWISRHKQLIFDRLLNSDPTVAPENCCQWFTRLEEAAFVDAHKRLGYHYATFVAIFDILRNAPRSVAEILNTAEQLPDSEEIAWFVYSVIYGSCVFPRDERYVLDLMAHLIDMQMATPSVADPRRVLRRGNVAFCRIYKLFTEGLLPSKVFLTAALHDPIMFLLSQDELYLDIDPAKSAYHFSAEERRRRFGEDETSFSYQLKLADHRQTIVKKLKILAQKFIDGILSAMSCFPSSLSWLVRHLHTVLLERKCVSRGEAALICIDLIFTNFLCPALANPEVLGIISDTPVGFIARFNLMQIGQILQTLALSPYEQPPGHLADFYDQFDKASMSSIVSAILEAEIISLDDIIPNAVIDPTRAEIFERRVYLCSIHQTNVMKASLIQSNLSGITNSDIRERLKAHVTRLPEGRFDAILMSSANSSGEGSPIRSEGSPSNSSRRLKMFAGKVKNVAARGHQRLLNSSLSRNSMNKISEELEKISVEEDASVSFDIPELEVLVFESESALSADEPLGLLSEDKFMEAFGNKRHRKLNDSSTEKKTRFLTVTTESIVSDRTTDAASDCDDEDGADVAGSICSSLDEAEVLQNNNIEDSPQDIADEEDISTLPDDNLSDGLSARGSPSESGRDTPFSGAGLANDQNDDDGMNVSSVVGGEESVNPRVSIPSIPVTVRRANAAEGLEEKFGKFGIPSQQENRARYRDETHSLVSDSWSTDVVASDNEGPNTEAVNPGASVAPVNVCPSSAPSNALPNVATAQFSITRSFVDTKRKLRLVLSSVGKPQFSTSSSKKSDSSEATELNDFLKLLLAESINARDKTLCAQIREVLRCLAAFDSKSILRLLRSLKDELRKRTSYILYMQQSKLTLLQLRSHLQRAVNRIEREQSLTSECLVDVLVRFYLQKREVNVKQFVLEFQTAKAQDEKSELVANALSSLRSGTDPIWKYASLERMRYAELSLERSLIANVYISALYPNGDADIYRDNVFFTSLQKLASVITPDHHELRIPKRLRGECPWPSAQSEIGIINAYKSAKDKMACVARCCETIQNLIVISQPRGVANADDIIPVLVYVLIQANPPALLSNMQYITGFHAEDSFRRHLMTLTNNDSRPAVPAHEEPYPEALTTKSFPRPGNGRLPTRKDIQSRFLESASLQRISEVEISAADVVVASSRILLANIIESATRLRRSYLMEESGYTHSYGTTEESIRASIGANSLRSVQRNKSTISARDILEAMRFDKQAVEPLEQPRKKRKRAAPPSTTDSKRKVLEQAGNDQNGVTNRADVKLELI
ncbi:hypothetical protein QR680_017297 [Steinernema hermaphroditum]|uniref:Ras-GAP domain-containing protein n=1 Tax=Steinernema hermaphroditum TaxID=289476 RepID=A0AA39HEK6_9BILA|nr:hypothetical protein QR680_017297 [Steinernema hermaphroditum]